jgi:serine/threonine protein kinase
MAATPDDSPAPVYNLCNFGWDDVTIPANLSNICRFLPKWNQLKILRNPQLLNGHEIYFPHHYFHAADGSEYMPALEKGSVHNDGGYAVIYKGQRAIYKPRDDKFGSVRLDRTQEFVDICIKEVCVRVSPDEPIDAFEEEINAILYEAYLHALVFKTLETVGYSSAVPTLYDIVATTHSGEQASAPSDYDALWMTMEFIEGATLENFLRRKLIVGSIEANETLLCDVLIQLAFVLSLLQDKLKFNHRDLKINNVYVRHHGSDDTSWVRTLDLSNMMPAMRARRRPSVFAGAGSAAAAVATEPTIWTCTSDIVLIDFGFSCVACGSGFINPRATLVGAGSYFKPEHDCLKLGRDLAQFLYSLHCTFPLQNYVSPRMFDLLHAACFAEKAGRRYDMWMGFDHVGNPIVGTTLPRSLRYTNGVYLFLRENDVDVPGCAPAAFLQSILSYSLRGGGVGAPTGGGGT